MLRPSQPPRRAVALLALLVAVSFGLRAWEASQKLHSGATWDEHYGMRNLGALLRGQWRPPLPYYPSLSYLPQAAVLLASEGLHRATGIEALAIHGRTADGWSATAYLLCRLTNVAFGAASLVLLFVVGRRIFGDAEGLLAAAILAAFPRHVLSSTHFKPDVLVVLLALLVFHWTLLAAERPTLRGFLRTGVGVGLAASAKYTGAGAAVAPLVAVLARREDRRQWWWLALAGVASALTFVLLNPWLDLLIEGARFNAAHYAEKGALEGSDRAVVLGRSGAFLVAHHGWVVTAFLVAGFLGLAWHAFGPRTGLAAVGDNWEEPRRIGTILLLGQIVGFAALHAVGFPLFRGQNFLPVAPFTSLVAAWAMVETWRLLRSPFPALGRASVAAVAATTAVAMLVASQLAVVYRVVVPSTMDAAGPALAAMLDQLPLRQIVFEGEAGDLRVAQGPRRALTIPFPRLVDAIKCCPEALDLADAEVVAARRVDEDSFTTGRARRPGTAVHVVATEHFERSGEPTALLLHPWRLVATDALARNESDPAVDAKARPAFDLPALAPGAVVAFGLWVPAGVKPPNSLHLRPGPTIVSFYPADRVQREQRVVTTRMLLPAGVRQAVLGRTVEGPRLEVYRWAPSGETGTRP